VLGRIRSWKNDVSEPKCSDLATVSSTRPDPNPLRSESQTNPSRESLSPPPPFRTGEVRPDAAVLSLQSSPLANAGEKFATSIESLVRNLLRIGFSAADSRSYARMGRITLRARRQPYCAAKSCACY